MFGESNTPSSIGPNRRGVWTGVVAGCLILGTAAVLVSGTVDGLNFFGWRLPDSTPKFSDPPKDEDSRIPERSTTPISARSVAPAPRERPNPLISTRSGTSTSPTPVPSAAAVDRRPTTAKPTERPPCALSGYAAVLEPAADPVGTALARSLQASDLRARVIELGDASDDHLARQDIDRIMAGDGSSVPGRISEGTLLVAQLKVQVRRTVIDDAPMIEVNGTMDLAIVRNNCGAITVQRSRNVLGRSVNETLDDGVRGLGEIFREKIADLVKRSTEKNHD
jgi:hypothetical protein